MAEEDPVTFECEGVRKGELPPVVQSMSEEEQAQVFAICENEAEQERLFRETSRKSFILPDSLTRSLGFVQTIGAMLVLILASLAIGVEYGWGTLRPAFTSGIRRWQFLTAKVMTLVLMMVAGLLVLSLTVVASSLIAAALTLHEGGGFADSGEWRTAGVMFGKVVYGLVPYVIMALFLSVLTSSSSVSIAFSLAYFFAESILVQILDGLFDWFGNVTDYLLGPSVTSWMTEAGVRTTGEGAMFPVSDPSSQWHAFFVIAAYIIILGVAAFWLFQRRDVAGARGE